MNGIIFYNFGNSCITRLLVSLYTLRKVYTGPVTLMLAKDDANNIKLSKQLNKLNITVQWFDLEKVKRNTKSAIKPALFKESIYDNTIMCDADLIFIKPIDELFDQIEQNGTVLTHFMGWYTNGRIMSRRLKILEKLFDVDQMKKVYEHNPAINIGVMGISKEKGGKFLRKWEQVTKKLAGKFIADEIAAHVYIWYDHVIVGETYNQSGKFANKNELISNHIIHLHGSSHTNPLRNSSRLWWASLGSFYDSNLVEDAEYWQQFDSGVMETFKTHPNIIIDCQKEYCIDNL